MKTEKRLTMALSVLVALMMLAVPLASSSNLFVDGGQTNSNGDAPVLGASSNDDITIKDVYIIKTAEELQALPIYDKLKSVLSKDDSELADYAPCLITIYTTNGNVAGGGPSGDKFGVKFDVSYTADGTNPSTKVGSYSGMNLYDSAKNEYYATFPLGTFAGDGDSLGITNSTNYYNQIYTVSAQLYTKSNNQEVKYGEALSMTSEADNVTIEEVWTIDDQASLDHMKAYGADPNNYATDGKWNPKLTNDDGKKPMSEPWIAVAYSTSSSGTVALNFSYGNETTTITKYVSTAGNHVLTAYLSKAQATDSEDQLNNVNLDVAKNKEYVVSATGSNGNTSSKSTVFGNVSGTYDVIFKLNSDENSLDVADLTGKLTSDSVVSWKMNADGDLVASVTISDTTKVSIEYLITQLVGKINRDGYNLTEWTSDSDDYTNMSYDTYSGSASDYANGTYSVENRDKNIDKNMTFTAVWELKDGWVEASIHVYQDDALVGDFIKAYQVEDKNTIRVNSAGLNSNIKTVTGINTYGIIVNGAESKTSADIREVYSSNILYGNSNELPANGIIASNSEITVNYDLNDRLYSKVVIHSEAFKDGKDVTLFSLKSSDYSYSEVFYALQQKDDTHEIKAALKLKADIDANKNAVTDDNYYLLTGWNDGAELLDSSRNAPAELTLDSELNGYYVVFMVNGQFEVVYIPFGELSADKCTIASDVKYWSYIAYNDYKNGVSNNEMKTFSFTKSQIDGIEKLADGMRDDIKEPIAIFVGSAYSFNNTAYAVFDAGEGNFGDKYVDKMIISGKTSSTNSKTTIPMPEVSPVYENTVVLVGYSEYHASGDDASTFGAAGTAQTFNANVIEYKYTITFYNGSEVNGIFYYSDATTFDKLLTGMPNFVAFSYKGTAYDIHDESDAAALLKAFSNVLYPAKDGYKATQWKDADGNVMLDKVTKTTMSSKELNTDIPVITYDVNFKKISSDMNFYANFEAEKYAIIYSGNTAAATNNMVQIGTVDGALTLFKDSTFTNDGYKLMGWNTRPDGDGTSYKLGESFTLNGAQFEDLSSVKGITNVPADITYGFMLYAIWEKVGSSDNPSGNSGGDDDNTNTYLLAGILVVIIILIIVVAVILRKKN